MRHDRITSNRDVTATIPVFRIGSRLSPWKRTVSSEESMPRAWFTCLVARRILVRHFERIVARNKLIIIVIEIFLVQTSTPPVVYYRPVWIMETRTSSPAFYLLTLFVRWICARSTRLVRKCTWLLQARYAIIELYYSPFTTRCPFFFEDRRETKYRWIKWWNGGIRLPLFSEINI